MNERLIELGQRRSELLARIARQREQLADVAAEWDARLAMADHGVAAVLFLRRHPLLVAGVTAVILMRRSSLAALMWGVWRVWKGYRYFISMPDKLPSRTKLDTL
ncbi:MAG TPA: YqjK-like family protein [Gallionella sp.]|nr:YqjK-like family protein [Gallionella sp.]